MVGTNIIVIDLELKFFQEVKTCYLARKLAKECYIFDSAKNVSCF